MNLTVERPAAPTTLTVARPAEGVVEIRLAGSRRRNVLGRGTLARLSEEIGRFDQTVRVVLLTSDGPDFCAGFDLFEAHAQGAAGFVGAPQNFAAIRDCGIPLVAAIQGRAIGGGLELALTADVRFAARTTRFSMPASELGLVYSEPGVRLLVEAVGWTAARHLLLTGHALDARAALRLGLVTDVVPSRRLRATALSTARRIAGFPAGATRGNRTLLDVIAGRSNASPSALHANTFEAGDFAAATARFVAEHTSRDSPKYVTGPVTSSSK